MGKLMALICFLVGSSALANTNAYELKMELSMNGKHVSSPRLITEEGKQASITQESDGKKMFIDVIATEKETDNKQAILMKFVIGTISATGKKTIVSTPQIISLENLKAEITIGDQPGKEDLSLAVVATRKIL